MNQREIEEERGDESDVKKRRARTTEKGVRRERRENVILVLE
jgi:hypothetical protein